MKSNSKIKIIQSNFTLIEKNQCFNANVATQS